MEKDDKKRALQLLIKKETDLSITYAMITRLTGYSKRQLIRMSKDIKEKDMDSMLIHGNTGKKPVTTASDQEVRYLCEFKKPYPVITIAQFRDIFLEDVIQNNLKQDDVVQYGLKPRSLSWFRQLFIKQGWKSPAQKPIRRSGDHKTHPIRTPLPRRGMMVQIDGTEYDWFQNGTRYTLHLCVDDATTEVLAGWFMPTECVRGYSHMMLLVLQEYGVPERVYSDKHSIFRSVKSGELSQFGLMLDKLHIKMIFANSPEAKGRVERYNQTEQMRLVNDITRFKIHNVDQLNEWFNRFYRKYLNKKFAFLPRDPNDAFVRLQADYDLSMVFRIHQTRVMKRGAFKFETVYYSPYDDQGNMVDILDGTTVNFYIDTITEAKYIEYYGNRYIVKPISDRYGSRKIDEIHNQKELQQLLNEHRNNNL